MSAEDTLRNLNLNRLYLIYNTIHEMMIDRGYTPQEKQMNRTEFITDYLERLRELDPTDIFSFIDDMSLLFATHKHNLLVYFHPLDSKFCQNDMNYIHNLMIEKNAKQLVIVANNRATPKVSSVLGILGHNAQLFSEEELIFNVTKHQLVPKHIKTSPEERQAILEAYGKKPDGKIHLDIFPAMFSCDPISKYYNFKIDDLVRIERLRKDGYIDISYRVVTSPITDKDKKGL